MRQFQKNRMQWTTSLTTLLSFIILTVGIEFTSVLYFRWRGVSEIYLLTLIPVGVIMVLTSCWTYLTRQIIKVHRKPSKGRKISRRRFSITMKSAAIVIGFFLGALYSPLLLRSRPMIGFFEWIHANSPMQIQAIMDSIDSFFEPFLTMDIVYKYAFLQNFAACFSALVTVIIGVFATKSKKGKRVF